MMPRTTQLFFKISYKLHLTLWNFFLDVRLIFRLLLNREAIEILADAHCQNCLSGKDIMLRTTHPFFKSYCELKLLFRCQVWLIFNREAIEIRVDAHSQNCLSVKNITLKLSSLSPEVCMNYI